MNVDKWVSLGLEPGPHVGELRIRCVTAIIIRCKEYFTTELILYYREELTYLLTYLLDLLTCLLTYLLTYLLT